MEPREIAQQLARTRIAIGVGMLVAPGLALRAWLGADASRATVKALGRALGVRDVVLGLLTLEALDDGSRLRRVVQIAAACDAVDAAATVLAARSLPKANVASGLLAAGGGALTGAYVSSRL